MTERTYFGPCRAGLHPEFGWGEPCQGDAAEYVSVDCPVVGLISDGVPVRFDPAETLMRPCPDHALLAEQLPGFNSRRPLTVPYTSPVVRL